jgi:hypothetical protein
LIDGACEARFGLGWRQRERWKKVEEVERLLAAALVAGEGS